MNRKRTIFISDLHLDASNSHTASQFCRLLKSCDKNVDAVYVLGDLFEVWIGDDDLTSFNQEIMSAFTHATKLGLPIYFMHGNRDFLIRQSFLRNTGCTLLEVETVISLYGEPVLLMHGDTLCTNDLAYMRARKLAQNRFLQNLFLALPLFLRVKIADRMRMKSLKHTHSASYDIMDVASDAVTSVMQKHQVNYLIHGHTHKRGFHQITLADNRQVERIVLGAWHPTGNALIWYDDGEKEIIDLPN